MSHSGFHGGDAGVRESIDPPTRGAAMVPELELQPIPTSIERHQPLLSVCSHQGCTTLTMGDTCVEHDLPVLVEFPRGRPYVSMRHDELALAAHDELALAAVE